MKLSAKDVRPTYKHSINYGVHEGNMKQYMTGRHSVGLDFDVFLPSKGMNLQRPLVWTLLQKQQLILSMLREVQLPKFVKVRHQFEDGTEKCEVLDGKQRLNAIFQFIAGEFKIEIDGQLYGFNDLDDSLQSDITNPKGFIWDVHYSYSDDPISDETKIQIFEQINFLGTPQDIEHLNSLKA